MIQKSEHCKYCGAKMESKSAKRKFCSDTHRVYWNRENNSKVKVQDLTKPKTSEVRPPKTTNVNVPPAPERKDFSDNWAYLEAKAIWKDKYLLNH